MNTRIIGIIFFSILARTTRVVADDVPFGMFATNATSVFPQSEEDAFFAAFDEQTGESLQRTLLEQKALDDAQKEYEAHLFHALQQRKEKRAAREQHVVKYDEQADSAAYKFRNRQLRKQISQLQPQEFEAIQQQMPDAELADHVSVYTRILSKKTDPCRSALSVQQLNEERASRKERVKAFAVKQAEVTRQAVAAQHEILALCHDIEKLRIKGGRYSNAHSSAMIKTEHSH